MPKKDFTGRKNVIDTANNFDFMQRQKYFSSPICQEWVGGPPCLAKLINGALSLGVKQPGRETIRLLLRTAYSNNECSNISIPYGLYGIYIFDFTCSFI